MQSQSESDVLRKRHSENGMLPRVLGMDLWIALVVLLNLSPHLWDLHLVVALSLGALWLVAVVRMFYVLPRLATPWILALNLVCLLGVLALFGKLYGYEPAVSFLLLLSVIKLFELSTYRDRMVVLFLCYVLLLARLLVSQSLSMSLFLVLDFGLITHVLYRLQLQSLSRRHWPSSWYGVRLFLQTLPLFTALFFLFPRFGAGFLLSKEPARGRVGLSGELSPGELSELVQSDALAFRAQFEGKRWPAMHERYWRAKVLSVSGGMRWQAVDDVSLLDPDEPPQDQRQARSVPRVFLGTSEKLWRYSVLLEPRFGRLMFGLDVPQSVHFPHPRRQRQIVRRLGQNFASKVPFAQRVLYQAVSLHQPHWSGVSEEDLQHAQYLQLPRPMTERLRSWLTVMGAKRSLDVPGSKSDREIRAWVAMLFEQFRKGGYVYTLEPGSMTTEHIEEFLFETKRGFCEHFAASFGTLMRYLNIPSRVVIGFHGGEQNPFDASIQVKDRDAHAWNEVWLSESQQWWRLDPTAAVDEVRLALGGRMYHDLRASGQSPMAEEVEQWVKQAQKQAESLISQMVFGVEALSNQWNVWLLSYDYDRQLAWLEGVGLGWLRAQTMLFLVVALGLCVVLIWFVIEARRSVKRLSRLEKSYLSFLKLLRGQGLTIEPWQSEQRVLVEAERCFREKPEQLECVRLYVQTYLKLRYAAASAADKQHVSPNQKKVEKENQKSLKTLLHSLQALSKLSKSR